MLVVLGVALTLPGADGAELPARGHLGPRGGRHVLGLAAEQAKGRVADVGAVEAEADASAHLFDVGLGEICVRARCADLQTRKAVVDAPRQEIAIELGGSRMSLENLLRDRCGVAMGGFLSAAGSGWAASVRQY